MDALEYTTVDKTTWGDGPWQTEPDKRQWADPATGLPCLIVRGPFGALCGYVGVAEGHPLFGKSYDDVDVRCHGGLTFSDMCNPAETAEHGICHIPGEGEPHQVFWFGFDASHSYDYVPGLFTTLRKCGVPGLGDGCVYRDLAYMTESVTALAAQLKELA